MEAKMNPVDVTGGDPVDEQTRSIRILVLDRLPVVRRALATLLSQEDNFHVVGEAGSTLECRELIESLQPQLIVFASETRDLFVIDTVRELRELRMDLPIIILTELEHSVDLVAAMDWGVQSCLLKDSPTEILYKAIRIVGEGGSFIDPALRATLSHSQALADGVGQGIRTELTTKEHKVLQRLAEGKMNEEIATSCCVTKSTVKYHLQNIYEKLGVSNRTMAVKVAVESGLLQLHSGARVDGEARSGMPARIARSDRKPESYLEHGLV